MMKFRLFSTIVALIVLIAPYGVSAEPITRSGEVVSVEKDQMLEGDYYALGSTVTISGTAQQDVYVAGRSVTINAPIEKDLVILGGVVHVHAAVADDVRVIGGEVTIAEKVKGDVVILGGVVDILSTAEIEGSVLFLGGEVDISGEVHGSVFGGADSVRIDAPVGGDVTLTVGKELALGNRAAIEGNVVYRSATDLILSQDAVVVGSIQKRSFVDEQTERPYPSLLPVFMLLFAALSLYLLGRSHVERFVMQVGTTSFGFAGLIGLALLVAFPFIAIVLMISGLGLIVGVICMLLFVLMVLLAWSLSGAVLGTMLLYIFTKTKQVTVFSVIVGTILFGFLPIIPYAGLFVVLLVFVVTLGSVVLQLYRTLK